MQKMLDKIAHIFGEGTTPNRLEEAFKIEQSGNELSDVQFTIYPEKIIWPLREGEFIDNPGALKIGEEYSLTYPGTASSKCVIIFQDDVNICFGGHPSYEYCRITLRRESMDQFQLVFRSKAHSYYVLPFKHDWKEVVDRYHSMLGINHESVPVVTPRYMLQLGVIRPNGEVHIRDFQELLPVVDLFHDHFGDGHILHFYGTNKDGFDRMFPDYTIDPKLGGEKSFCALVDYAKSRGLQTSQHYNPRIADTVWVQENPSFAEAIVKANGEDVREPYAGHFHYVMNPNHPAWFNRCLQTVDYLADLGLDYLEIDQFVYQRNFFDPQKPLALGYQALVDAFIDRGIKFWVEGLSDVFRLPPGNFCQILIRDRSQIWEDGENRRGYPYGHTYADFFMHLCPDTEVSYQVFTEHKLFDKIVERLSKAQKIHAAVYDVEMGFYDSAYIPNLKRFIDVLETNDLH